MIRFLECTKQELEYLSSQIPQLQFALQDPEVSPFADYNADEVENQEDEYDDETNHSDKRNAPRNLFREFYGLQVTALFLRPQEYLERVVFKLATIMERVEYFSSGNVCGRDAALERCRMPENPMQSKLSIWE